MMSAGSSQIILAEIFREIPGLVCAMSTRNGGVSPAPLGMNLSFNVGDAPDNVAANRKLFFEAIGVPMESVAYTAQVHGDTIRVIDGAGAYESCDGLITEASGVYCTVTVADCVPIFLVDPVRHAVGAIHAGWRGSAAGIAGKGVRMFAEKFGSVPHDLFAFVGPAVGQCCYVVGEDVARCFPDTATRTDASGTYVDLKGENARQLQSAGVPADRIEVSARCTISEPEMFHSHRRDGARSGRMMGVIGFHPRFPLH